MNAIQFPVQWHGMIYALPVLPLYFLFGPIVLLQGIYAKYFGLTLSTIATVLLFSRLFDAITDPIIGYLVDRYHALLGTRKPFILAGGMLFVLSSWFLYVPFDFDVLQAATSVSGAYFLGWFLAFYLAYTLFEIPHLAWGSELAADSQEKNKIYGLRSFYFFLGGTLFYAMPLLPWFETNEFTPQTLKWSVMVAGLFMLPMLYLCVKAVPETGSRVQYRRANSLQLKEGSVRRELRIIFSSKPLRILTVAHIFTGFGSSMCYTLMFFFADAYLGLGQQFALAFVISFALSILALKLWYKVALKWSKQVSWATGMIAVFFGMVGTGLLSPNSSGWLSLLLCMTLISGGFAAFNIMVPSLLSDIIDYGTWKFGTDRSATYFSLYTFMNKAVGALGGALGLAIAGQYGFEPTLSSHSDATVVGLRMGVAWIPASLVLLSIFCILRIPITAHHHSIIRRRLNIRMTRAQEKRRFL